MVIIICACWRVLVLFLIASASATSSTERPDHRCLGLPYVPPGCHPGRCCSAWNYCGSTPAHCANRTENVTLLSNNNVTRSTFVKVTRNNDLCDDQNSLSCVDSLKDLSSASLHKYEWASFRVNNNFTASTCGLCLKLTNVETGGEAMVRVVHEPVSTEASTESDELGIVELGAAAYHKLCVYVDCGAGGYRDLVVKYSFESCD